MRHLLIACALLSTGCLDWEMHKLEDGCQVDSQCGEFMYCETVTGSCRCVDDRGCGLDEFCNSQNFCQVRSGCLSNEDCPQLELDGQQVERICDVRRSQCIPLPGCGVDADCNFGNLCATNQTCIPGCRDNGDCPLGQICNSGQCSADQCLTNADCEPGERCNSGECTIDDRGPFCRPCQNTRSEPPECGDYANYCLIDTSSQSGYFCGIDCARGQECPKGYSCNNVRIVTSVQCSVSACVDGFCRGASAGFACAADTDCENPRPRGTCPKEGMECRGGEGAQRAYCSCVDDSDCPRDECRDASITESCNGGTCSVSGDECGSSADCPGNRLGHCLISGHRCYDNMDCDLIACVEGGCLIGRNCAPEEGLSCRDMPQ